MSGSTNHSVFLAVAACSEKGGPRESKSEAETANKTDQPSQRLQHLLPPPAPPAAPVINIYAAKHADEEGHCAEPKDWKEWGSFAWCRSLEWIDAERVIAIWTVVLGVATWRLWRSTDRLVAGADETAQRQLRAYISITPVVVLNWRHKDQKYHKVGVSFNIENHGQTIGTEIAYDFSMKVLDFPLPEIYIDMAHNRQYDQNNSLFPRTNVPVRLWFDRDLTGAEIAEIESGAKRFHTWGTMHYRDAFKELRHTRFSFSFGGPDFANYIKKIKDAKWNWEYGKHHNDAG